MTDRCPKCGRPGFRMKVNLFLDIPAAFERQLSKGMLRRSEIRVEGAGWETAVYYCPYPLCGYGMALRRIEGGEGS